MSASYSITMVLDGEEIVERFDQATPAEAIHLARMRFEMTLTEADPMAALCRLEQVEGEGAGPIGMWAYQGFGHDLIWVRARSDA
jgi:hypothetical protein